MRALQRNLSDRHNRLSLRSLAWYKDDALSIHKRTLLDRPTRAEPEDLRFGLRGDHLGQLVFGIQHKEVVGLLVLSYPRLHRRIILKAAVPVQMVGRNVQHHCDPRTKLLDRL